MGYKEDFDAGYNALDGGEGGGDIGNIPPLSPSGCVKTLLAIIFVIVLFGVFIKGCMPALMDATKSQILQSSENL